MFYHLLLTNNCNLCCRYCGEKAFECKPSTEIALDEDLPLELDYDLKALYSFLSRDPDPTITFYGGEPTLRNDLIREIMDNAPAERYMIQTNAQLLDKLEPEYVNRFHTILVSIDGSEKLTDHNRGKGVYRKVMDNAGKAVREGFKGELIARMCVTEDTDIFKAVTFLAENPDHSFSSIHWQMDANFWNDFKERNYESWLEESYKPGIEKLARLWIEKMREEGRVLFLYPFLDLAEDLLLGRKSLLRCGSGYANYSIMTNGFIAPCPIMAGMKEYYVGDIFSSSPKDLKKVYVSGCDGCESYEFCGGRCLYSDIVKPWSLEQKKLVCGSVKHLERVLKGLLPEIKALVSAEKISLKDFEHLKYNGCEIIP